MRRSWPYVIAGLVFAGVLGWISYTDALFVTRLAGNDGGIAYAYPTVPDGLLFFSLLALTEAARAGADRPRWATAGLILGAAMTLAANAGAGLGHSILDAVIDALVPVCFFIAVEIVLWHVRQGSSTLRSSTAGGEVPSSNLHAARMRLTVAAQHGFKVTPNDTQERFGLTRAAARGLHAEFAPKEAPAGPAPVPAGVHLNGSGPHG